MSVTAESSPSPFVRDIELITASDDEIRRALDDAEIAPLLPALAYLTGDLTVLREDLRPDPLLFAMPQAGLSDEQAAAVRALALETLIRYRDDGSRNPHRRRRTTNCSRSSSSPSVAYRWPRTSRCSKRNSPTGARTVVHRAGSSTSWRAVSTSAS